MYLMRMNSKDLIRELQQQGWKLYRIRGSHHIFKHPHNTNTIVVPHPKNDLGIGLVKSILKQMKG